MIKNLLISSALLVLSVSMSAQSESVHIFCSSNADFKTIKGKDIISITHEMSSITGDYLNMVVNTIDGEETIISLNCIDSVQVRTTDLPEIYIELQDDPTATELWGSKKLVHPATLRIDGNGMYDDLPEQTVEFRGRGNTSWEMKKKPYRFKMTKKSSVCELPKAKTFALIANYIDCSLMRNAVSLWVANYLGMPFSNHCVPVKVYLNGIYKGAYMLTEKIGIGGGSVDIDETTGMLFELDSYYDEEFKFKFSWDKNKCIPVMVKDPDLTEICEELGVTTDEYFAEWQTDFSAMANAIVNSDADDDLKPYIDLESAVNFFIVNNLASNHEMSHPKSLYIYKESLADDQTYHFGPVWDFDWAYTFRGSEGEPATVVLIPGDGAYNAGSFLKELFKNTEFRAMYKEKWEYFVSDGYPQLKAFMEEYAYLIEPSAIENGQLWPADYDTSWRKSESSLEFRQNFETLKTWIENRIQYCSNHKNYGLYE